MIIAKVLQNNSTLTSLDLAGNKIGPKGAKALADALREISTLTSLKLILQFLNESNEIQSTAKNSIEIALSSVFEMEEVITQLLNFARPKPSKFTMLDVNQIIRESIAFIQHQIDHLSVRLVEEFDPFPALLHRGRGSSDGLYRPAN